MSAHDATGRLLDARERRVMHHRGFGDGAKFSAQKFPEDPDYMEAWEKGLAASREYMREAIERHGLPQPTMLRINQ